MHRPIVSNTSIILDEAATTNLLENPLNQGIINHNFAVGIRADSSNYMLYSPNPWGGVNAIYDAPRHAQNINSDLNKFYEDTLKIHANLVSQNPYQAQEFLKNRLGFLEKVTDQQDPSSALNQSGLQNVMVAGNDGQLHQNFGSAQVDNLKSLSDLWTKKNLELSELAKPISPSQQGSEFVVGQGSSTLGSQSSSPSSSLFHSSTLGNNYLNQAQTQIYLANNTNQYDPNSALRIDNPPLKFVTMLPNSRSNHVVVSSTEPQYHHKTLATTTRTGPQLSASQNTRPIGQTGLADNNQDSKANGPTRMPKVLNVTKLKEHVDLNAPDLNIINFNRNTPKVLKVEPIDAKLLERVKQALLNKNNSTSLTTSPRIHPRSPSGGR
ncbi:MAG: hypothetical protein ACKO47_06745 [Alphaproteobacteria bacterium]